MAMTNSIMFLSRPKISLSILGLWLTPERTLLYKIYMILIMASQYSFLIFNLIYMVIIWGDLDAVSEASYLLFTQATLCYKATAFMVNKRDVEKLFGDMDSKVFAPQTEKHVKILAKHSNTIKNVYTFLVVCTLSNCTEWAIVPLLENKGRNFPYTIWMPVDAEKSPDYEVAYLYQTLAIFISAAIFIAVDIITVGMIMFGVAQLDIIMDKTEQICSVPWPSKLKPEERKKLISDNNELLIECIEHHHAVIRFLEQVENTFHINIFFQLCGTVVIVCIIIFNLSVEPPNTVHFYSTLNYLVTMLVQLLIYCWFGNELTSTNEDLRDCLYQCAWYEQDMKFRKVLLIAMECMKRPIIFKAGHYIPLSRPAFVSILRCSYSYFAVLNQAKEE